MKKLSLIFFSVLTGVTFAQKNTCQQHKHTYVKNASLALAEVGNNSRSDTFDIVNYSINLDLMNGGIGQLSASCDISLIPLLTNQSSVRLDLFGLTVDSVKFNNLTTTFNHTNQSLNIDFPTALAVGDTQNIQVYYQGSPLVDGSNFGGFDFNGNYWYNLGVAFQYEPHNFGRGWFPCFDNFVERSTYNFEVKTPKDVISYANGNLISSQVFNDSILVRKFKTETDFPTYLASVAAAPYIEINKTFTSISGDEIPVVLACLQSDSTKLENSFVNLKASFDAFEEKFGPYKWEKIGYSATPVGAMEHPGNIAYPTNLINGNLSGETIMAHELAHHWFGNLITCNDASEMWINEGWAEYLSIYFLEAVYGPERYLEEIRNNHLNMLNTAHTADGGYQVLAEMPINITYGRHTYNKGADVIHSLRSYMGDTDFFNIVKGLLTTYSFQDISSEQFRDYLLANGFTDANDFFTDWIFQKGWAQFDINTFSSVQNGSNYDVSIEFVQNLRAATTYYNNVPLNISFFDENNVEEIRSVKLSGEFSTSDFSLPFNPTMVAINGDDKISLAAFHEKYWVKETGSKSFPNISLKTITNNISDSTLLYLQQNWVEPSGVYNQDNFIISTDRYWQVKSPDFGDLSMDLELRYHGNNTNIKDFGLMQNVSPSTYSEDRMVVLYREHGGKPWLIHPNQNLEPGSDVYNKIGKITISNAQKGDYVFAISKWPIGVTEIDIKHSWEIFPNPTQGEIHLEGYSGIEFVTISDTLGKTIKQIEKSQLKAPIQIDNLPNGTYIFTVHKAFGNKESKTFVLKK